MTKHQAYPMRASIIRNEDTGVTRVDVYDDIGGGASWWDDAGLTAKDFAAQLAKVTGPLDVHINSAGGAVDDGIAIGNNIRSYKGPKRTVVDGMAASIASVIMQAGDERVVMPGAMVFVHDANGLCIGNAGEMAKFSADLDKHSDNIAQIYADRAGGSAEQWRGTMRTEKWYTADEAVEAGLADRRGDGEAQLPSNMDLAAFSAIPGRIAARLRELPATWTPSGKVEAKASDTAGGGGGGQYATNLTVTAGTPAVSYTIGSGGGGAPFVATGVAGGTAPVIVNADGTHDPFSGSHSHSHAANGSQGDDDTHDHGHSHDGDADHGHSHADGGDGAQDSATQAVSGKKGKKAAKKARLQGDGQHADSATAVIVAGRTQGTRILGAESMPLLNEALPVHHTATVDTAWDGPAAVAAMPGDAKVLRYCHAWQDTASDDGAGDDPDGDADDQKASYKFPHHKTKGGPANLAACRNGLARLSSASIPAGDAAGVKAHLQAHLDDGSSDGDTDDHHDHDISGIDLEQIRAGLKGANE